MEDLELETLYRERSRTLFNAAEWEADPGLRLALAVQSEKIGHKALSLQLKRRAQLLLAMGLSPVA